MSMDGFKVINPSVDWKSAGRKNERNPNVPLKDQPYGGARVAQCTDAEERACYGEPPLPEKFGRWTFDRRSKTLDHEEGYFIELDRLGHAASMLDWIFQVGEKTWATNDDKGHLLSALQKIFDPQRTLCSFGHETPFDAGRFLSDRFPPTAKG